MLIGPGVDQQLLRIVGVQPYPLLFATISGAHLYGFPSPDSDFDLRGVHVLPMREVVGLDAGRETIEVADKSGGLDIDLVTHDVIKFLRMLLKRNGYVLEQLLSPLIVHTKPEHEELRRLAAGCITRHHADHYLGFADTQWGFFEKHARVKYLLYVYRVLLTGIHLMRTGLLEANLVRLNEQFKLSHVSDLIMQKTTGQEKGALQDSSREFHEREYRRLVAELESARDATSLPPAPTVRKELNEFLVRVRMTTTQKQ